jgi:hypothetical protein
MRSFVVDVNVAIVANAKNTHADLECMSTCVDALINIRESGKIVLDDGLRILSEYTAHLSRSGQPGVGDAFMRWIWEHQAVENRCEQVQLTPKSGEHEDYMEFPTDPDLKTFDRSDRKYVAAALTSREHPEVLNAVDTDWWEHRVALERNGVNVRFLCIQHMEG